MLHEKGSRARRGHVGVVQQPQMVLEARDSVEQQADLRSQRLLHELQGVAEPPQG